MKSLFISLVALVGFALPALGESSSAFVNAYDLQEACFRGSPAGTTQGDIEVASCRFYIAGVIDTIYTAAAETSNSCLPVTMDEIAEALAVIFTNTADEELQHTTASSVVMMAFSQTPVAKTCFYGGGVSI